MNVFLKEPLPTECLAEPSEFFLKQITWHSSCCCQTLINLPLYVCVELILWTFASANNLHFLIIFWGLFFFFLGGRTAAQSRRLPEGCLMCRVNPYSTNQQVTLKACCDCVLIMSNQTLLSSATVTKNILYWQLRDRILPLMLIINNFSYVVTTFFF